MFLSALRSARTLVPAIVALANVAVAGILIVYTIGLVQNSTSASASGKPSFLGLFVVAGIACLASAAIASFALWRSIVAPLEELIVVTKNASEGRRNGVVQAKIGTAAREINFLGRCIREMAMNQQMILRLVREASGSVSSSAHSLEGITERTSSHIGQAVDGINKISDSINSVAKNTQAAAISSRQAVKDAQEGRNLIVQMVQTMKDAQFSVTESAGFIMALGRRSGQIAKIVDEITRLADQTNVLSLNAAIEAVRAGEAGKGFGVVAAEVGKLAESSARSAQQVTALMEKVREETQLAVDRSVKAGRKVTEGYRLIQETEKRFITITEQVNQMTYQMQWMADHIDAIAGSVKEATASSAEQTSALEQISFSSKELTQVVNKLRLLLDPAVPKT